MLSFTVHLQQLSRHQELAAEAYLEGIPPPALPLGLFQHPIICSTENGVWASIRCIGCTAKRACE